MGKRYTLKNKNKALVDFIDNTDNSQKGDPSYPIVIEKIHDENIRLFPFDLQEITGDAILNWVINRRIPKGRKHANLLLGKYNLNGTAFGYIDLVKGLSLTDTYWIVPYGSKETWEECSLYRHPFNETMASLAFTGEAKTVEEDLNPSSPEFTTNGALPKKWIRRGNQVFLMKGTGALSNNEDGRSEPFSEMYASQLADYLGLVHIPYQVEIFPHSDGNEEYVSLCPLYTSENISYIPMVKLLDKAKIDYRLLATEREERKIAMACMDEAYFSDMVMFDCLIGNTDRHLNNFGVIASADTNEILGPMPIFDNGAAFWNGIYLKQLESNPEMLFETEGTSFGVSAPVLYKRFKRQEQKEKLQSIKDFRFNRNTPYTLPNHTLEVLERNIQIRAQMMLE